MNVEPAQCGLSLVIAWSFKSRPLLRVIVNQMIYLALSFEVRRSADLARRQNLHVILLSTPAEQSARSLARRRGVPQAGVAHLASSAQLR